MVSSPAPTSTFAPSAMSSASASAFPEPLSPISSSLYGSSLSSFERVGVRGDPAVEALALLDDLAHRGLDLREVLGHERGLDVEVVVEAVLDRRADAELRVGEELLHGLGHHVRGGVPQDVAAVLAVDRDALDLVAVGELVGEVAQLRR